MKGHKHFKGTSSHEKSDFCFKILEKPIAFPESLHSSFVSLHSGESTQVPYPRPPLKCLARQDNPTLE